MALAPYPQTADNRLYSISIMHALTAKLRALGGKRSDLEVVPVESKLGQDYLESDLDPDTIGNRLKTEYLWTLYLEQGGHQRRLFATLRNQWNPYDTTISRVYTIDHLDALNNTVSEMTYEFIRRCWSDYDSSAVRDLDDISMETESGGIRVRGGIVGFSRPSREMFLGNSYRYGLEVSGIYYALPLQFELLGLYDFGKQENDRLVYGRYVTLLIRYNIMNIPFLWNVRAYAGVGPSLLNLVRVQGAAVGKVEFGITSTVGFEVLLSRKMYFDLCGQSTWAFSDTESSPLDEKDFPVGRLTFLKIALGFGYRFPY